MAEVEAGDGAHPNAEGYERVSSTSAKLVCLVQLVQAKCEFTRLVSNSLLAWGY